MKQKLGLGEDCLQSIEENLKTEDEDDDIPVYERRPSNESTTSTASVDSKISEKSSESIPALKDSSKSSENLSEAAPDADVTVTELTENLKCLKVDEKKLSDFDKIKNEVKETEETDIEDRSPSRRQHTHHEIHPYNLNDNVQRSSNLLNGGTFELPLSNSLPVLTDEVLNVLPPLEFTIRQPSPISTPNSTPSHYYNVVSPSSGYESLESRSPMPIPIYVNDYPHSSEEEERRKDAIHEIRLWMDSDFHMKDIKMKEWIRASSQETVEHLFSDLDLIIQDRSTLTNRKFVRMYAIIAQILNREGDLKHFFLEERNILSCIVAKNNPLLLRYIIETIFNLGLNPENIGEPLKHVWDVIIKSKNELNQTIDMSEMLTTLLTLKNRRNVPMFSHSLNEQDDEGFTVVHKILKMCTDQQLATKYFKICLDHQPNLMLTTILDSRTYMHHALLWGVPPQILDEILKYCTTQYPNYNILQEIDVDNKSPMDIANRCDNKVEILAVFEKYSVVPVPYNFDISTYFNNFIDHPWPDE